MAEELAVSRELVAKIRRQLIESRQIPNLPGRVGADGKLYTSAGLPKEPTERAPKEPAPPEEDARAERGRRGMAVAAPPAEPKEVTPVGAKPPTRTVDRTPPEVGAEAKAYAGGPPIEVTAATIDEMLEMMSKQIMQMIAWTQAEGFLEAYRHATPNARGLFHTAAIKLAARADQLRRG
jgi:hypothetical protein